MMAHPPRIPPDPGLLTRFLRDRQRLVPMHEIATLFGWSRDAVRRQAAAEGVPLPGGAVPWTAAASWLLDIWPLGTLFEILGYDATLLPRGLQLLPVQWKLPAYIVHGLRVQSQIEPLPHRVARPADFEDYLRDLLHRAIDTDTAQRLKDDHGFTEAYEFPYRDEEE
jgi:hypothetical protein